MVPKLPTWTSLVTISALWSPRVSSLSRMGSWFTISSLANIAPTRLRNRWRLSEILVNKARLLISMNYNKKFIHKQKCLIPSWNIWTKHISWKKSPRNSTRYLRSVHIIKKLRIMFIQGWDSWIKSDTCHIRLLFLRNFGKEFISMATPFIARIHVYKDP